MYSTPPSHARVNLIIRNRITPLTNVKYSLYTYFSAKIFGGLKIPYYLCIAMLNVVARQCEDTNIIQIAKAIYNILQTPASSYHFKACGGCFYTHTTTALPSYSFECFKQ